VTVSAVSNGTVTLSNNLISVVINTSNGSVQSIVSNKLPGVDLLQGGDSIGLELSHIGGISGTSTYDYWTDISAGGTEVYSVVENSGTMVDIQIRNPTAAPDQTLFPHGIWDWTIHHVMFDNDPGFYTYHVWRHTASQQQSYWDADSWQGYTNGALFASSPINTAWDFCGVMKNGVSVGDGVPSGSMDGVPQEVEVFPYSSYFTQPTGQYYESNWPIYTQPTGLTHDLYPTWTKYDWPTYLGPYTSYRNTWGVCNDLIGIWHCNGSSEWRNGGPTKLSGAMSGDYMYMDDDEGHGLGGTNTDVAAGEVFTKVIGPFFTYVNTGSDHNALWADAQARGLLETERWPYAWANETEADYPRNRGTVTGRITTTTGQSTANAVVVLGMPITPTYPDWIWQGTINYLYWTTADQNGNFTIPKVDPSIYSPSTPAYTLYCYVPGVFASGTNPTGTVSGPGFVSNGNGGYISCNGEYVQNNITVAASGTTNLGTIVWNPPRAQNLLFQLGIPDRSTSDFRFGDLIKQFGLWWRYYSEMGTNDLNFNVGTSNCANDWYYAQPIFALPNGTYCFPHWNINFNLAAVPTSPVTLTMNLAGGYGTYFYIYVNGTNVTPGSYNYAGIPTNSGADIYRDVVQIGQFQQYLVTLPSTAFKTGSNTLQIQLRQPGFNATWNTSGYYPDLIAGGLMYDAIKLESGPLTTQMIQNGTYKIGSGLNGFVARVQNGSTASGAAVVEYPFEFIPDEEWTINDLGNDVYSIIAVNSGMALTVQNASKSVDAPVVQSPYTGATSQQWQAVLNTSGGLSFINVNSGLALDITGQRSDYQNNVQLIQNTSNNGLSQSWYETPQTYGPPPAVTDLTATSGNGQVALAWSPAERATAYTIMRGVTSGSETTTVATNVAGTTCTDTPLTNGTNYYYVVVASDNPGGASPNSNEASVTPLPPLPQPPANLVALPGTGQATLSWSPSTYATSYTLSRTVASGGTTTVVASGVTETSATDTGLTDGRTYNYTVAAVNLSGTGANSNVASVTPTQYKPGSPTGLTALSGNRVISLAWTAAGGAQASSYVVERGTSSGVYTVQFTVSGQYMSYLDMSVTNGSTYYYVVEASNQNGSSAVSNQVSAVPAASAPAVPTGLAATGGNQQIGLSWNASTGAAGYTLVRGTSSGIYPVTVLSNAAVTSCTDTGVMNGTVYYYAVSAMSLGGTSANSTQVSATPSRSAGVVIWTGNTNIVWDTATPNWQYAGAPSNFQSGDTATFGDGGNANNVDVFLTSTVTPGNITVNTAALSYAFAGVGSISGTTGLTFNGNGNTTLSIGVDNNFSGKTNIQNGTLRFYSPGNLGTGSVTLTSGTINAGSYGGGTLQMGNNPISMSGVTNAVIMAPAMNLGPVTGFGTMNITVTDATGATKADNLTGGWSNNFTGTLNFSSTVSGGSLLSAYFNGGTPDFDGNLGNATVNFVNIGICSIDASKGNTISFGALNGDSNSSIIGSAYAGGLTVNIGGLNTASTFAGGITDSTNGSGNTALIKSGTGSLTLSGSCAYTGATSVTQGNLTINGMLSGSGTPVTVSSGASLSGTGSINGTVTVNSGASLLLSATGNLAVNGNMAFGGAVTVSSATTALLSSGTYTLLTYTGSMTGTPVFTYVPQKGINQAATFNTSTPGVITVNLSGPPAAPQWLTLVPGNGQVGASWNASTGATGYIIKRGTSSGGEVALTGGTTASTSYTDTAVTDGVTYYYTVTATNSYGTGGTSGEQSAIPVQNFGQWIAAAFPGVTNTNFVAMTAIPAHDGMANLLKYFMGLNPAKQASLPITCALDGHGNLVIGFRMSKNLTGVSYSIDQSTDLETWTSTGLQGGVMADMGSYETMDATVPLPASGPLFLRLSISSP